MYYNSPKHGKVLINPSVLKHETEPSLKGGQCGALFEAVSVTCTTSLKGVGYVCVSNDVYIAASVISNFVYKGDSYSTLAISNFHSLGNGREAILNKLKDSSIDCVVYRPETQEAAFLNDLGELTAFELDQDVHTAEVDLAGVTNVSL
jgi:hypothetical protein